MMLRPVGSRLYGRAGVSSASVMPRRRARAFTSIPHLDVSSLLRLPDDRAVSLKDDVELAACVQQLSAAARDVGFFTVTAGHGVSDEKMKELRKEARAFFELPQSEKEEIAMSSQDAGSFRGYQRLGENVTLGARDVHEAIDLMRDLTHERECETEISRGLQAGFSPIACGNPWPRKPPNLRALSLSHARDMGAVGLALSRGFALALGLNDHRYFDAFFSRPEPWWIMRLIYYPPRQDAEEDEEERGQERGHGDGEAKGEREREGQGEHTDYGFLTLISADRVPGTLRAKNRAGEWVEVVPSGVSGVGEDEGGEELVCNIGDMLEKWSGGAFVSTPHKVASPSRAEAPRGRISVPYFFEPSWDARIAPIDVAAENDRLQQRGFEDAWGIGRDITAAPAARATAYSDHLMGKLTNNFAFKEAEEA